jgi:membrane peptidoglycan carboxypeptidase
MTGPGDIAVRAANVAANRFWALHSDDSPLIFRALLTAEDRRGMQHDGIDWISVLRAIAYAPAKGRIEGLSTIEQQLARTIFPRRNRQLLWCKLFELRVARSLKQQMPKPDIWAAYLELAYYGAGLHRYGDVRAVFLKPAQPLTVRSASCIVACLKYPRPHHCGERWLLRHRQRTNYIGVRMIKMNVPSTNANEPSRIAI